LWVGKERKREYSQEEGKIVRQLAKERIEKRGPPLNGNE
jgi:hypothetical protein